MDVKKAIEKLMAGKTVVVTPNITSILKNKRLEYVIVSSNFSHNSSLMGGKRLVNTRGERVKSKSIKIEIKLA